MQIKRVQAPLWASGADSTPPEGIASIGSGATGAVATRPCDPPKPPKRLDVHAPSARTAQRVAVRAKPRDVSAVIAVSVSRIEGKVVQVRLKWQTSRACQAKRSRKVLKERN